MTDLPIEPAPGPPAWAPRIAVVLAVAVLLVVAQQLGVFHELRDPAGLRDAMLAIGPWGYLAFVVAYATLQPFGVPGTVFIFAAPLIWPWPIAFGLSMVGTMAASVIGFSFARFVARDWIAARIPARFRKYDEALARRAFATVVLLRFVFWMPPLLHAFFGVSKVPFGTHFWGSFLGYLVPLFLVSFFGQKVVDWMRDAPPSVWIGSGAAIVVVIAATWLARRRRAAAASATGAPPPDR